MILVVLKRAAPTGLPLSFVLYHYCLLFLAVHATQSSPFDLLDLTGGPSREQRGWLRRRHVQSCSSHQEGWQPQILATTRLQEKPKDHAMWFHTIQLTAPAIKWSSTYVTINNTISYYFYLRYRQYPNYLKEPDFKTQP